ncbi:TetR/AcrR family transcriptional regulator [Paenibacillus ginsengihumi]|uniref:TetR/AcrR family transcriptional regulator n=1 Tax=Paenibacillus ginsengihumi TaxID=431596 RepID=UPI00035F3A1B|nr:TetR/AcrR family transcriptional regulator [Paenibacillus ginsengihumi]
MEPKQRRQRKYRHLFKEEIREAAFALILQKGITGVTFGDIAQAVGTSRVTLYSHYSSIHDIIFDIQISILTKLSESRVQRMEPGQSGADKLRQYLQNYLDFFKENKDYIRFTAIFDHAYSSDYPSPELQLKYSQFISNLKKSSVHTIVEGIRDGSLRADSDPELLAETVTQTMLGLMQRLATRKKVVPEPGCEDIDMLERYVQLIVDSLRAE